METDSSYGSEKRAYHLANAEIVQTVLSAIEDIKTELQELSTCIHEHPETKWEEHYAHDLLTAFMEKKGWLVKRSICDLATAWSAEFSTGEEKKGVTIGYNSEMDALPHIGHACGHNLIAISGVAAAIGTAAAMRTHGIDGRVLLLGTPAEEGGGGKVVMLQKGAYKDMAACLMLHPGGSGEGGGGEIPSTNAKHLLECEFFGKPAHAAVNPAAGINALDAATIAYMSINAMRQQVDDAARIHGIMGGESTWVQNIIPAYAKLTYGVRHQSKRERDELATRVKACFSAAAAATGCTYKITEGFAYDDLQNNSLLAQAYKEVGEGLYGTSTYKIQLGAHIGGSTDFGNVSHVLPACHPVFYLPNAGANQQPHTPAFTQAAGESVAVDAALKAAGVLGIVGSRIVQDSAFRNGVRDSWTKAQGSTAL